jgi:hypothetical protein
MEHLEDVGKVVEEWISLGTAGVGVSGLVTAGSLEVRRRGAGRKKNARGG